MNRESIIQTEDKGSCPSVGTQMSCRSVCEQKCKITCQLVPDSDLHMRGQMEYMHNDR